MDDPQPHDLDHIELAFSRAQKVLVLTAPEAPKGHFAAIWQGLPQWPYVQKDLLVAQRFEMRQLLCTADGTLAPARPASSSEVATSELLPSLERP